MNWFESRGGNAGVAFVCLRFVRFAERDEPMLAPKIKQLASNNK
jgi:hypothetical protein